MPFSYRKATKIIAISKSTKVDITRILKIPEDKIEVVPQAVDEKFSIPIAPRKIAEVCRKYNLRRGKYILHVGTLEPRKNLGFLVNVFGKLTEVEGCQDLSLAITGKKGWYYEGLFKEVRRLGLRKKVVFTGYVDEADKPALYQGAKIFAFPSLYEGFGLPLLEAMASGVPVVSSNTSSMPEVVGDAGILLSPNDEPAWVKALCDLSLKEDFYEKYRGAARLRAGEFSWGQTAQKTIAVYEEAMRIYREKK